MKTTPAILPVLASALALQGCTLDFDTAFDQAGTATDAAVADQSSDAASPQDTSPPGDSDKPEQGQPDAVAEAAVDSPAETGIDAPADVPSDTSLDAPPDVVADSPPDAVPEAGPEPGPEPGPEAGPDAPPDVSCPSNMKMCGGSCVPLTLPEFGCAANGCTPCALANATQSCSISGSCEIGSCNPGHGDCNKLASDGCEASLTTVSNCGECGKACVLSHANETCAAGVCAVSSCSAGWGNCDNNDATGCETDLETKTNCGSCGTPCDLPYASESCSTGTCKVTSCTTGHGNCDKDHSNGCETLLNAAPNCGACGETCQGLPHVGAASCSSGACKVSSCVSGYGDCDANGANGCETDVLTSVAHCGGCGQACLPALPNHTVSCVNGGCQTGGCLAEWGDCDLASANGCEAFFFSDPKNCGACGNACKTSQFCAGGHCVSSCADAALGCVASSTVACGSNVAVVGQYEGGARTVCVEAGDQSPIMLSLMAYDQASWVLTGAVYRVAFLQVYSMSGGVTLKGQGTVPYDVQIGGSSPADPYAYAGSMGDCAAHTGYTGKVFGVAQGDVCHMSCGLPAWSCLSINP